MPIEICKISRANGFRICSTEEIKPIFVNVMLKKKAIFWDKIYAVCDKNRIFHSYDFSPPNVNNVNYLNDIKYESKNCLLISDRA